MPDGSTKHTCMQCGYETKEAAFIPDLDLTERTIACQLGAIVCFYWEANTIEEQALIGEAVSEIPFILEGNWLAVSDATVWRFFDALAQMPFFQRLEGMDELFHELENQHQQRHHQCAK